MKADAVNASPSSRRRGKRRFRPFLFVLRAALAAVVLAACWLGYLIWTIGMHKPAPIAESYDVGIVLGAALWRNEPSPSLRERLDYALELYEEGRFGAFILTGGYDYNGSTIPEAEGMRNYLAARGVPPEKMLLDPEAQSTYDNLLNSRAIMMREGYERALIITHEYHSARADDIARYLGYDEPGFAMAESAVVPARKQYPREVLAFTKWKLDSLLLLFGKRIPDDHELGL